MRRNCSASPASSWMVSAIGMQWFTAGSALDTPADGVGVIADLVLGISPADCPVGFRGRAVTELIALGGVAVVRYLPPL